MADTGTYLNAVMVLSGKCAALRQQLAERDTQIARLTAERDALRTALENIPYEVFGDAQRDGLDSNGAWDVFVDESTEHVRKALESVRRTDG